MAIATAFALFVAPSFRTSVWTCSSTVRLVMWRISPISEADLPRATHAKTSRSRGVNMSRLVGAEDTKTIHWTNP